MTKSELMRKAVAEEIEDLRAAYASAIESNANDEELDFLRAKRIEAQRIFYLLTAIQIIAEEEGEGEKEL